eukprot:6206384-Pleurochrysis_carterae.AAC.3
MPLVARRQQRRRPILRGLVHLRTVVQQKLGQIGVPLLTRGHECSLATARGLVDVGAAVD